MEAGVGVAVAVGVLEGDGVAGGGVVDGFDLAVVDGDGGGTFAGVDLDLVAGVVGVDDVGGVLAGFDAFGGLVFLEVVGVACAGGDGEAAFCEAGAATAPTPRMSRNNGQLRRDGRKRAMLRPDRMYQVRTAVPAA